MGYSYEMFPQNGSNIVLMGWSLIKGCNNLNNLFKIHG